MGTCALKIPALLVPSPSFRGRYTEQHCYMDVDRVELYNVHAMVARNPYNWEHAESAKYCHEEEFVFSDSHERKITQAERFQGIDSGRSF